MESILLISVLFFCIATLYSSVGHAGASGYLAIFSLLSWSPELIKPLSLLLNCIVACIASIHFIRNGFFDAKLFIFFIISSVPFAFLGGLIQLPNDYFKLIAGIFLLLSAVLLIVKSRIVQKDLKPVNIPLALLIGAIVGFVSGLIGVGGGIFLSPIILLMGWTTVKKTAGISALFILLNSLAGLFGQLTHFNSFDSSVLYLIAAVVLGGFLGSFLGSKKLNPTWVTYFLVVVLVTAGIKFVWIDFMAH